MLLQSDIAVMTITWLPVDYSDYNDGTILWYCYYYSIQYGGNYWCCWLRYSLCLRNLPCCYTLDSNWRYTDILRRYCCVIDDEHYSIHYCWWYCEGYLDDVCWWWCYSVFIVILILTIPFYSDDDIEWRWLMLLLIQYSYWKYMIWSVILIFWIPVWWTVFLFYTIRGDSILMMYCWRTYWCRYDDDTNIEGLLF